MPRKEPLINDPRAPTKHSVKLPSGKRLTLKRKKAYDKGRFDTQMREQYLALIREGVTNKDAAAACGCGTKYFKRRRDEDPEFEQAYQEARTDGDDVIRAEIHRRGVDGVKRAIYHDGRVVGHKKEYSDQLLMFLAKSRMPQEFGDKQTVDHVHKFEGAAEQLVDKMAAMLGIKPPALPPQNPDAIIDAEYTEVD
ncbi:terminase small subunit [Desulfofustis phage LS06-2018-MD02]|jgi:hypothetical protein|nr:terminase small subunit [Desulfofustis phage LS06-2018-MD02]